LSVEDLSPQLRAFIAAHITSVDQLEALLLLKSDPQKKWTDDEVSRRIYTSPAAVKQRLQSFVLQGLLSINRNNEYSFSPATPDLADRVEELEKQYRERRVTLISVIYDRPHPSIQAFSDAFKLKKPGEEK
jgi:hypothetical protein